MKTKVLKFPDGKIAVVRGVGIRINKQKPILEEEVGELSEKERAKLLRKPSKFKFSKKARKLVNR